MKIRLVLIFLIASSIAVQNTCPFGLAGKTGFAAKHAHHYPLKEHLPVKAGADDTSEKLIFQSGQIFVFTVGNVNTEALLSFQEAACSLLSESNLYKNIYLEPPVKPPLFV